jgi:hypothetical protein
MRSGAPAWFAGIKKNFTPFNRERSLFVRWTMLYIGFSRARAGHRIPKKAKDYPMTYLDVLFRYGATPGETELRAIDGMREVYGVRRVQFNERERTVRVEFDASRLKADAIAKLLRQAGVDVREQIALV